MEVKGVSQVGKGDSGERAPRWVAEELGPYKEVADLHGSLPEVQQGEVYEVARDVEAGAAKPVGV